MEILIEGSLDYCEGKEWKKRYFVMKYEISSALRYIEFYKDKNWRKQLPRHVVNLHPGYEVKRIKNDPKKKYGFSVQTTDHCLMLASDDENTTNQWLATFEEYNLVKSFCVQPQDTATMIKIEAIYPCHLQMVHSEVRLVSAMDGKLLGLWPFKCIRRYKFTGDVFCIEAGRKAPTGEGMFEFISNECSEIYRVMDTIIRTKAGDSTIRRLASHKLPQRTEEHQTVRKTLSHPHSFSTRIGDTHYDYATADCKILELPSSRLPPAPPAHYTSPPTSPPLSPSDLEESHYDALSPGELPSKDFTSKLQGTISEKSLYDSLQFKESGDTEGDTMTRSSSAGSYDTLVFSKQSTAEHTVQGAKGIDVKYDKLQFTKPTRPARNNEVNQAESVLKSGDVYDTLSHLNVSEPLANTQQKMYDSLNSGQITSSTYDSLVETNASPEKPSVDLGNTYDHMSNTKPKSVHTAPDTGVEKPTAPLRAPPRCRKPSKGDSSPRRPVPERPSRLLKPSRKTTPDCTDANVPTPSTTKESIKDAIKRRSGEITADDGGYAKVEHEYASIDYSKVTRSETNASSDVYSEPTDVVSSKTMQISFPKPTKPKRNPPKAMKNLFKKSTPTPPTKPKTSPSEGEGDFANELKKKLEIKLKKSEAATAKDSSSKQPAYNDNPDDGIYDEVDHKQTGFSADELDV